MLHEFGRVLPYIFPLKILAGKDNKFRALKSLLFPKFLALPVRGYVGHHVRALALDSDVVAGADLVGGGALGHQVRLPDVPQRGAGVVAQPTYVLPCVPVVVGMAPGKGQRQKGNFLKHVCASN